MNIGTVVKQPDSSWRCTDLGAGVTCGLFSWALGVCACYRVRSTIFGLQYVVVQVLKAGTWTCENAVVSTWMGLYFYGLVKG